MTEPQIVTMTLEHEVQGGWLATIDDGGQGVFVPGGQADRYQGMQFTAVVVDNNRDNPPFFCQRLRPLEVVSPADVMEKARLLPVEGYSDALELAHAAGICDKFTAQRRGKVLDNGDRVWYVRNADDYYIDRFEMEGKV
jgi:hypothetical protein